MGDYHSHGHTHVCQPSDLDNGSVAESDSLSDNGSDFSGDDGERGSIVVEYVSFVKKSTNPTSLLMFSESKLLGTIRIGFFSGYPFSRLRKSVSNSMNKTIFEGLDLTRCRFDKLSLEQANFSYSTCQYASFRKSKLKGADFNGAIIQNADFTLASGLTADMLASAKFDNLIVEESNENNRSIIHDALELRGYKQKCQALEQENAVKDREIQRLKKMLAEKERSLSVDHFFSAVVTPR